MENGGVIRGYRYQYKVYDLNNELILCVDSMRMIMKCMGVSEGTILSRLKRRVTKRDDFKNIKCRFNIKRIRRKYEK